MPGGIDVGVTRNGLGLSAPPPLLSYALSVLTCSALPTVDVEPEPDALSLLSVLRIAIPLASSCEITLPRLFVRIICVLSFDERLR